MTNIQKVGACASLAFGIAFTVLLALLITIASQGYVPGSENDAAKALEFAASSPIPYIIYILYALFAILMPLVVLALTEQLEGHEPVRMQLTMLATGAASILFLAYAMLGCVGAPALITVYQQNASIGATAYIATRVISNALNSSAIFAAGWAILLAGWTAIRTVNFPKGLAVLLLLAGGLSVLAFLVPLFSLLAPCLYIGWSIWLGVFLLGVPSQLRSTTLPSLASQE